MIVMKVQSLARTFNILELLSKEQQGLGLTDISNSVELHKSTVYRLLSALMERGYIEKRDSKYKLGLEFVELCSLYLNSLELKTEAEPALRNLSMQTTQTVFLATQHEREIVYMDKVETFNSIRKYSIIGQRRPIYCTSIGKSFLFNMSNEEIQDFMKGEKFESRTKKTLKNIDELIRDVEKSRKRGWALDDEEWDENVCCIGAPIYDYRGIIIAAVSTAWHLNASGELKKEAVAAFVMEAAAEISKRMGFRKR